MLEYLNQNWGNILVCLLVLAVAVLCVVQMIRKKKAGKGGCGCSCGDCPSSGICHPRQQ